MDLQKELNFVRQKLEAAEQKLEAVEQKLEVVSQKLELLQRDKLHLETKQLQELLPAEKLQLAKLIQQIEDLKKDKEDLKKDKEDLKKDKEDLKKEKGKWMDMIDFAMKNETQKRQKYYEFRGIVDGSRSSEDNEMEVDSSSSDNVFRTDGINIHRVHLQRQKLLAKLVRKVAENLFVRLTSPAASGKTSLLKLYEHSLKNTNVIWISCLENESCFQLLATKGIDLKKSKYDERIGERNTVIFIDDAQAKYEELDFWALLIKFAPNWLPDTIRFIISSTHLLSGGTISPIEFSALPGLERNDFLLTEIESNEFLELPVIGLPQIMKYEIVKQVIIRECGGLIGALRKSIDSLKERFAKDIHPSEAALLQHFLSNDLLSHMARCFGSAHSEPIGNDFKMFLKKIFVDEKLFQNGLINQHDNALCTLLQKSGILVELPNNTFAFSSQLAKRYYFKWIFPRRSATVPSSLPELIRNVVSSMSATVLKNSTLPGDFPKEAVFQHLFMEGLASYTPPSCSICPELSKVFPSNTNVNTQQTIAGEIDFYLNGSLRWGIELLVNGDGVGEHISRFTRPNGKYVSLDVKDYAVVDFRRNQSGIPTNISKHPNRVSAFFKNDDYSVAHCVFGEDSTVIEISLG